MNYFAYILESEKDSSYYIGHTEDLEKRIIYHNEGKSKYTSRKMPWKVVYYETFKTRKEAHERERFLKKQRNRAFYKRLIDNWSGSSVG